MFPLSIDQLLANATPFARPRYHRPPSRLEVQARKLEYQSMNPTFYTQIDIVRSRADEIERSLPLRRQISESRRIRPGTSSRVRRTIGQLLIAAGERIRPELA